MLDIAWQRKKSCYLPCLTNGKKLLFAPVSAGIEMAKNRYGILEPQVAKQELLQPKQLNLVLAPLIGFDSSGNRLGMGGGYYDRSFAFLKQHKKWQRPHFVGIGYDFQQVEQLGSEEWDVPLESVISNKSLIHCKK